MPKKKRRPVPKAQQAKKRVPDAQATQDQNKNRVYFTFLYSNWLKSYKHKEFTTFLKDESMYSIQITYLFSYLIPKISECWRSENTTPEFKHCHEVKEKDKSYSLYIKAIKSLHPEIDTESLEIWQFGFKVNSMRIICHKEKGYHFIPLLIDQHHLGSVDKHYNEADFGAYNFCPVSTYK